MAVRSSVPRALPVFVWCALLFLLIARSNFIVRAQGAGNAVTLSGNDYIRTTLSSSQLFDGKSFTFEFWFNASSPGVLVGETDTVDSTKWNTAFAEILAGGVIRAGLSNVPTVTVGTISFGEWNHMALVYNSTNREFATYLNGAATRNSTGLRAVPSDNGRQAIYTFGRGGPTNLGGGDWFSGQFDEVRIWRFARNASQIASYWNHVLSEGQFGLMAIWHFDTTNGSLSPDSSASADPALYLPEANAMPLSLSSAPVLSGPIVATKTATQFNNSASLRGLVNPQGTPLDLHFDWGATAAYGSSTSTNFIDGGFNDVDLSESLTNLPPGPYHFRIVGQTSEATFVGADATFTIAGPSATTRSAVVVGRTAQLLGTANPRGIPTSVFFEWGSTTNYGNATAARDLGSAFAEIGFTELLTGLTPGQYHYRGVATFQGQRAEGTDVAFTILPPTVQTKPAVVTITSAQLPGTANPQGVAAKVYFQWGATTNYGNATIANDIGPGTKAVNFTETLANLPPGDYHFRGVLTNATDEILGADQKFSIFPAAGSAVKLSGNDFLLTTLVSNQLFDSEDFTIEMWFNATSPGVLISEVGIQTSSGDCAFAEVFPDGTIKAGVPGVPTFTVGAVPFGTWHHFALVYDGGAQLLSGYLDGQPSGSSAGDRIAPAELQRTAIYGFGRGGLTNLGGGSWFSGFLDEIRIWRRPLAPGEIATQFDKILTQTDSSLFGNWHLDSTILNHSADSSGNYNTATYVPAKTMPLVTSTAPVMPDLRPLIVTNFVKTVTPFSVEWQGSVNAQGTDTVAYFEYGRSNILQQTTPRLIGSLHNAVSFSDFVSGLEIGMPYQYRIVASNGFGVTRSAFSQFVPTSWPGYAYHLEPNDSLNTANLAPFFPGNNITIELWFYPTKAGVLVSESVAPPYYDTLVAVMPSGSVEALFVGLSPIIVGQATFDAWNHVAVRYDSTSQTMDSFLNGEKGGSTTGYRTPLGASGGPSLFAFGHGGLPYLGSGQYFTGDLDEIRVWNVVRSDEDLTSARFNLLTGDEPGLVLNWSGNAPATDPIYDSSANANNGANVGGDTVLSTAPLVFGARSISSNQFEAQFVVKGNSTYILESTSDFTTWTRVATNTASTSGYIRLPLTIGSEPGGSYFRVVPQ